MPFLPATDWCAKWALYAPAREAFREYETGRILTYARLNRAADALAWYLTGACGLKKGDRVAVLADMCLEYTVLFGAAQKTGIILVPLNYRLATPELNFMLKNAAPKMVLAEPKYRYLLDGAAFLSRIPHQFDVDIITTILAEDTPVPVFPAIALRDKDPLFILYTSGTTGFPKGALYTHKMLYWNSINTAMSLIINTESRALNFAPPFHTGCWNVLMMPFLHHGGYTCILKKFDPAAVLQLLQEERCTILFGVPTMLRMLADEPGFERAVFPDLKYAIVGGEPMPLPLIEQWHAKGVRIRQGYGMTEVGPNLTSLHQDDALRKRGSIGRPNFYVDIQIVDGDGKPCAPGEAGELLLRGPMVTPGYWRNPEATAKAFAPGGWFRSGDLVRQDEDAYLFVVDRIKNMFISGGENVYPVEVERVLLNHPAVSEAAVVGMPDEKWGEVGRAFVVLKNGTTVDAAELQTFCRAQLAAYKVPKNVVFIDMLPKNDAGKINRMALKGQ